MHNNNNNNNNTNKNNNNAFHYRTPNRLSLTSHNYLVKDKNVIAISVYDNTDTST